jgi:glycosyltransferase involved in cell wall biosynthesis
MAYITFITPYKPIICGIADYTEFITRACLPGSWSVLSFDLARYGVTLSNIEVSPNAPVCYCIPSRDDFSASSILKGIRHYEDEVLWFQHEFGIWPDDVRFVNMLRGLDGTKVVSPHSLHFQSDETIYGLRLREYSFLKLLLPCTDAITVFSNGVYNAVTKAFPEYSEKIHVLRHGTHLYPDIAKMSRLEAKKRIHEFLIGESGLDQASKEKLMRERIFIDPEATIMGGSGFITHSKGIEPLFRARDMLNEMLPDKKIVAVYVGFLRQTDNKGDSRYVAKIRSKYNDSGHFFSETYLPGDLLPIMLRALDVHLYWPSDCTQSGIIAHALGAGATIACRDMEGVGETVKKAGGLTLPDFDRLIHEIKWLVLNPDLRNEMSERAVRFAKEFSWENQASKHFELAEQLYRSRFQCLAPKLPIFTHSHVIGKEHSIV